MTGTTNGKAGSAPPYVAPDTETEIAVAPLFCEILKLERIGRDDRFFDLGLDSFSALRVSLLAEEKLGLALNTSWMTDEATLRTLCARLAKP